MIAVENMTEADIVVVPHYQSLLVGLTYSILSAVLLSIYMVYNLVLLRNREFRCLQAFRLMLFLGVFDCIQLLGHFIGGILTIREEINESYPYLCQVFGATLNSAWVGLFPLSLVIAINRLLIFRKSINPEEKLPIMMKVAVFLSFLYSFAFWICLITFAEVTYFPKNFAWSYSEDPGSKLMSDIEFIVSVAFIVLTFLVYVSISVSIYKMTKGLHSVRRTERQLLAQAVVLFLILTTLITCWHYYQVFLPDTMWTLFSINIYWILYCGLNPVLHITLSRLALQAGARFATTFLRADSQFQSQQNHLCTCCGLITLMVNDASKEYIRVLSTNMFVSQEGEHFVKKEGERAKKPNNL